MQQRDAEFQRRGAGGITAIGVLGGDAYDKLLVLRALRPAFPEALFFTTDLDARLADQGEIAATRNLLIASSFDLQLRPERQGDIPPFRDNYQTAAFLSTQVAVSRGIGDCCEIPNWDWTARVFEIGRGGAFAFPPQGNATVPSETEKAQATCRTEVLACRDIRPDGRLLYPELRSGPVSRAIEAAFSGLLVAALGLGGAVFVGQHGRRPTDGARAGHRRALWAAIAAAGGAAAVLSAYWNTAADWLTQHGQGEPMLLFDGISLWPTLLLRLVSFVVAVALILRSLDRLDRNVSDISLALRLERLRRDVVRQEAAADRERGLVARLWSYFSLRLASAGASLSENHCDVADFWRRYIYCGRLEARLARVAFCVGVMFVLGFSLSQVFGVPNVPARDAASGRFYFWITLFDVIATQSLIFLVADATLFSCRFVRHLRAARSVWPDESRRAFQVLLGVDGVAVDGWLDLEFVARRSRCIMGLIYGPFVMLALLIVSRSSLIDTFAPNLPVIIVQAISLAVVVGCVLWLRHEAEEMRNTTKLRLRDEISDGARQSWGGFEQAVPVSAERRTRLNDLIDRADALQEGAFSPFSQQPMVKALLVPLSTYGGTYLLEYLTGS
jgi:hypothetical protein